MIVKYVCVCVCVCVMFVLFVCVCVCVCVCLCDAHKELVGVLIVYFELLHTMNGHS